MFGSKKTESELSYWHFEKIEGSNYLMIAVCSSEKGFKSSHLVNHNYLFLNTSDLSSHWLFPANNQLISTPTQIPKTFVKSDFNEFYDEYSFDKKSQLPIGWLLFLVKKSDKDGAVYISDASGENLTLLINEADYIKEKVRKDDDSMLIFYSAKNTIFVSEIKLSEKKVIQTKELPKIQ